MNLSAPSWHHTFKKYIPFFNLSVGSPGGSVIKNLPAKAGDPDLIPGSGRSPEGGNGNSLQYSCLENPRDGGAWWAAVYGVAQGRTRLKRLSSSSSSSSRGTKVFPGGTVVKNLSANAGDVGSIPGSGSCPGIGNGNPLQYSCLGNPTDRA